MISYQKAVNDENQPKLEACIENKKEADLKTMIDVNSEHVKRMMLLAKGMKIEKSPESLESRTQSKFMKMTPQKELKEPLGENIDHLQLITKIKKSLKTEKSFESSEAISESKLTPEKKIKEPLNENTDPLKLIKKLSAYSKPEKSPCKVLKRSTSKIKRFKRTFNKFKLMMRIVFYLMMTTGYQITTLIKITKRSLTQYHT